MHGNQWVLKIAVLKYYSVSKRGTTAKSNPKQATDPISLHTKFGDNSSNTFPLNERKPCVTPDIGRRTSDIGQRTSDGEKSKNNISTPQGGGHNNSVPFAILYRCAKFNWGQLNNKIVEAENPLFHFKVATTPYWEFKVTISIIFIYFNTSDNLDIKIMERERSQRILFQFDDFKQVIGPLTFWV